MTVGTIAVTGANGQVGRALLLALQGKCDAAIALVREPVTLPATQTMIHWQQSAEAQAAIAQADAVVHLAGSLQPQGRNYRSANVQTTETVVAACKHPDCRVKRIVFLSYVTAAIGSANAYLSTKAEAEHLLQASGIPCTIFRCTHIIGPPTKPGPTAETLLSQKSKAVTVLGSGQQQVQPIYVGDVVAAIIAALERDGDGAFALAGPEQFTLDELVDCLNPGQAPPINHIPSFLAKLLPWVVRPLPPALVDVMLSDCAGNPQAAIATFDLKLTALSQVWSSDSGICQERIYPRHSRESGNPAQQPQQPVD